MFKRTFWFGVGAATGASGAFWAKKRVQQAVARYAPPQLTADATDRAKRLGRDVREAFSEGRRAMRTREDELRARRPQQRVGP